MISRINTKCSIERNVMTFRCLLVERTQESQSAHPTCHLCTVTLGASGQKPTSHQVLMVLCLEVLSQYGRMQCGWCFVMIPIWRLLYGFKICENLWFFSTEKRGNFSHKHMHTLLKPLPFFKQPSQRLLVQSSLKWHKVTRIPFSFLGSQWLFGGHSPPLGLSASSPVEWVPIFPHVCPAALSPPVGKTWIDKRMPNCKVRTQVIQLDKWASVITLLGISVTTENSVFFSFLIVVDESPRSKEKSFQHKISVCKTQAGGRGEGASFCFSLKYVGSIEQYQVFHCESESTF